MRLDLHVHSTASDGACSPDTLVRAAGWGGLDAFSLTDHDTADGVPEAIRLGNEAGVRVLPGIEVSSTWEGRELHVLGYFIDPSAASIRDHSARARTRREARLREMARRLESQGIKVPFQEVVDAAGPDASVLGRPHLAGAMVRLGFVETVAEAFDDWIGDGHEAFVPTDLGSPEDAVRTILDAGGIPVWAHPPGDIVEELVPAFVAAGLRGIEVFRARHQPRDVRFFSELAEHAGLLMSGGSDWHSEEKNGPLGRFYVGPDEVGPLLEAGGW